MRPYWITFGQSHIHKIDGNLINKDCVVEIQAEDAGQAHNKAIEIFGGLWAFVKEFEPDMSYYPRGIIKLNI